MTAITRLDDLLSGLKAPRPGGWPWPPAMTRTRWKPRCAPPPRASPW